MTLPNQKGLATISLLRFGLHKRSLHNRGFAPVLILVAVVLVAAMAGGVYYFGRAGFEFRLAGPVATPVSPTPTPQQDETSTWKAYTTAKFTFRYPPGASVEERDKNFFTILLDPSVMAPTAGISVDARLNGGLANYTSAIGKAKENLTDITIEEFGNGTKISGKAGPGYGAGVFVRQALIRYGQGAISVETSDSGVTSEIFDQILSTFRFD